MSEKSYPDTAYFQLRRRTWERLLPHLERAVEEAVNETFEIRTELSNVRNAAYCRTEGLGDQPLPDKADESDDWLSI